MFIVEDDYLRDEASTVRKSYDENDDMYESVMGDDDDGPINSTTSSPIVELDSERTSSKCPNCLVSLFLLHSSPDLIFKF